MVMGSADRRSDLKPSGVPPLGIWSSLAFCPVPSTMPGMRWRVLMALATVCVAGATAQREERKPVIGRVLDELSEPLAQARVTLVGVPSLLATDLEPDVVEAVSEERGRWRADLLVGVPYVAWAASQPVGGKVATSRLVGWLGAGAVVDLHCGSYEPLRTDKVAAAPGWAEETQLGWCSFGTQFLAPRVPLLPDEEGRVTFPPLPRDAQVLWGALDAQGGLLHVGRSYHGVNEPLRLHPPRELRLAIRDAAGAPLADASLRVRLFRLTDAGIDSFHTIRRSVFRDLGSAGEDGTMLVKLPAVSDPFEDATGVNLLFAARVPGHAELLSGFAGGHRIDSDWRVLEQDPPVEHPEIRLTLPAVELLEGVVRVGDEPRAGCRVKLHANAKLHMSTTGYMHDLREFAATTDANGRFAFDRLPEELHSSQLTVSDASSGQVLAYIPPRRGRALPVAEIDLSRVGVLDVLVLDERRGPSAGGVCYVRHVNTFDRLSNVIRLCTDSAGRASVPLWPGDYQVFSASMRGMGFEQVKVEPGACRVEVAYAPYGRCQGVLVDGDGEPVAGARLSVQSDSVDSANAEEAALLAFARARSRVLLRDQRTAADGTFAFPYVDIDGYTERLEFRWGRRRSALFEPSSKGPIELRLRD